MAIVSDEFARSAWPTQTPIGQRIAIGSTPRELEVVGVVKDAVMTDVSRGAERVVYVPQRQQPEAKRLTLVVRSAGNTTELAEALRHEINALDPSLPVYAIETLAQYRDASLGKIRYTSTALALCGALALSLATIGIYGVISFAVGRRQREIGIRVALGALQSDVVALFLRQGLRLTAIGLAIGLALALAVTRLLSAMLLGITALDLATFAGVAVVLATVAQLAIWIPARRAARIDPLEALRQE